MSQSSKNSFKITLLSLFFLSLIVIAFFQSRDILFGVKIKNVNITDGKVFTENIIQVTGNARNAIKLTLDGREISVDQSGNFNETIALLPGYNIINITARDKFDY